MGMRNYGVKEYGILINPEGKDFRYLCDKLRKLSPELSDIDSDIEFVYEVKDNIINPKMNIDITYIGDPIHTDIDMYTLSEKGYTYNYEDIIILKGGHKFPSLIHSPFNSKEDCIEHYKEIYCEILPEDFDYENHIGEITFSLFG